MLMYWNDRGISVRDGKFILPQMFPVRRWGVSFHRLFIGIVTSNGNAMSPSRTLSVEEQEVA